MIDLPPIDLHQRLRDTGHVAGPLLVVLAIGACGVTASSGPLEDPAPASTATPSRGTSVASIELPPGSTVPDTAAASGLVILAGPAPDGRLYRIDRTGVAHAIAALPGARGLSGAGGRLLVTTTDGRLLVGEAGAPAALRSLTAAGARPDPTRAASLSPDGMHVAIASPDAPEAEPFELSVVPLARGEARRVTVRAMPNGPPFWIDRDRIAIRTTAPNGARHLLLASYTRLSDGVVDGPSPSGDVTIATGAGLIVGLRDATGELFGARVADWLAEGDARATRIGISPPKPGSSVLSLAITPDGSRLAIVWSDPSGAAAATIAIYERGGGWHELVRLPVPGGPGRALLTWTR
jgi:hypothetical protein